jgi:hypothetical protein
MTPTATSTRTRRSEEQLIQDLEAKIAQIKARAEAKKAKRDPSLRHISAALRSIDKALDASEDQATRQALGEARTTLSACLSLNGVTSRATLVPQARRRGGSSGAVAPDALLAFIQAHPGSRGEQIAAELGTDTKTMRPVMHRLIDERKVKTRGQRRGMTYHPV